MPAFSVATNGDLATSTKHCLAAITRIGVAAGFVLKALGTGICLLYPLPMWQRRLPLKRLNNDDVAHGLAHPIGNDVGQKPARYTPRINGAQVAIDLPVLRESVAVS